MADRYMTDDMTKTRFRLLILFYVVSLAAVAVDAQYFPAQVSEELSAAYAREVVQPLVFSPAVFLTLSAIALVAIIVPPVALFFFRKWGRWFGLCATVAMLVAVPFLGPSLTSGFGTAVSQLSAMLWGSILTLAYFSPVSSDFL
ncbi:hypothetical protein J3U99_22830 [Brucella pituitosa]|uniref:hypothetical protein n=1 Tax=Brucella pituitosa TaxID=571256 RepID=UPI0020044A54|nr:hypothetical protein [Brucella pituitosa]MCK4207587.1 hypothetical protein [Brucella pituitosa]